MERLSSSTVKVFSMPKEVLFEFTQVGPIMKVTAIDPDTGTEVILQGPAAMPRALLQKTAAQKLAYVLAKQDKKPKGH